MDEKNISYVVLGIVAVIAVIGLILLFKAAMSAKVVTGDISLMNSYTSANVYGGAIKGVQLPYYEDRVVLVNTGNSIEINDASARNPSQSSVQNRDPSRILSLLDSCEGLIMQGQLPESYLYEASWNDAVSRYGLNNCIDTRDWISQLCCKRS